jgi:hypothetical protein
MDECSAFLSQEAISSETEYTILKRMEKFRDRIRNTKGHAGFAPIFEQFGMVGYRRCFWAEYDRQKKGNIPKFSREELEVFAKTARTEPPVGIERDTAPSQGQGTPPRSILKPTAKVASKAKTAPKVQQKPKPTAPPQKSARIRVEPTVTPPEYIPGTDPLGQPGVSETLPENGAWEELYAPEDRPPPPHKQRVEDAIRHDPVQVANSRRTYPVRSALAGSRSLLIPVVVQSGDTRVAAEVLVDSGASLCIMSREFATQCGFAIRSNPIDAVNIRVANGATQMTMETVTVSVRFTPALRHKVQFWVMDTHIDVILGYNFLWKFNPHINWRTNQLTFCTQVDKSHLGAGVRYHTVGYLADKDLPLDGETSLRNWTQCRESDAWTNLMSLFAANAEEPTLDLLDNQHGPLPTEAQAQALEEHLSRPVAPVEDWGATPGDEPMDFSIPPCDSLWRTNHLKPVAAVTEESQSVSSAMAIDTPVVEEPADNSAMALDTSAPDAEDELPPGTFVAVRMTPAPQLTGVDQSVPSTVPHQPTQRANDAVTSGSATAMDVDAANTAEPAAELPHSASVESLASAASTDYATADSHSSPTTPVVFSPPPVASCPLSPAESEALEYALGGNGNRGSGGSGDGLFAQPGERLAGQNTHTHRIILEDGARPPKHRIYRLSPKEEEELSKQLELYLQAGQIRPSASPFGAGILFAEKKDGGGWRMCVDYRSLNKITVNDKYPIPHISECLDEMQGSTYFTRLDLIQAFHQIPMHPGDEHKTAFQTKFGSFEFTVMPFGLKNAPSTFQRAMDTVLRPARRGSVVVYFDDVVVHSKTLAQHAEDVKHIIALLRDAHFCLRKEKCDSIPNSAASSQMDAKYGASPTASRQ